MLVYIVGKKTKIRDLGIGHLSVLEACIKSLLKTGFGLHIYYFCKNKKEAKLYKL